MDPHIRQQSPAASSPIFSDTLSSWLKTSDNKTLSGLSQVFGEKAFAIIFLLMMALPALPIPTGGITHLTELITMLVSLQLIIGRRTVWLPDKWLHRDISKFLKGRGLKRLVAVIVWFEGFSKRRLGNLLTRRPVLSVLGLAVLIFTVAAFVAPPFSGLDTLPALGVVVISLALILEDVLVVLVGILVGLIGIILEIATGAALYNGIGHFF